MYIYDIYIYIHISYIYIYIYMTLKDSANGVDLQRGTTELDNFAMPLRCLVVDCGGVTHPDSGLKEARGLQDEVVLKHSKVDNQ